MAGYASEQAILESSCIVPRYRSVSPILAVRSFQCVMIALCDNEAHVYVKIYFVRRAIACISHAYIHVICFVHICSCCSRDYRSHKVKYQKKAFHECINDEVQFSFMLRLRNRERPQCKSAHAMRCENVLIEKKERKNLEWSNNRAIQHHQQQQQLARL